MDLKELFDAIRIRCGLENTPADWEFQLYLLISAGFHTFFIYRLPGMNREDMTALQRASKRAGGWLHHGNVIPLDQWLPLFSQWMRSR